MVKDFQLLMGTQWALP